MYVEYVKYKNLSHEIFCHTSLMSFLRRPTSPSSAWLNVCPFAASAALEGITSFVVTTAVALSHLERTPSGMYISLGESPLTLR